MYARKSVLEWLKLWCRVFVVPFCFCCTQETRARRQRGGSMQSNVWGVWDSALLLRILFSLSPCPRRIEEVSTMKVDDACYAQAI